VARARFSYTSALQLHRHASVKITETPAGRLLGSSPKVRLEGACVRKSFSWFVLLGLVCSALYGAGQANPPIYSEIIPTSSGLPYDPATDVHEIFVAPNTKTVEVLVRGPIGSGTYSRAIKPGETPDEYFPALVAEAVKAGAHHLVIPKAVYAFRGPTLCTDLKSSACNRPTSCNVNQYWNCAPHWTIGQYPQTQVTVPNSVADLDIDFSGSELDFKAPVIGIWILEAQRLRLRNLTIDWPELPIASLGTITKDPLNPGHNALVLGNKYPVMDQYEGGPVAIQAVDPWDDTLDPPGTFGAKSNNNFEEYFIFGNAPQPTYVGKTSAGDHTFSCESCNFQNSPTDPTCSFFSGCANFDIFAPGSRVIVRHYTYNGFAISITWANDIDFENLTLRTGPGIGIGAHEGGGYRGFRLANSNITRGAGRLISTASDVLDVTMQADVIVENNNIGYQGDDSVAVSPTVFPVATANGNQISVVGSCDPDPMDVPVVGDALAVFDENFVYKATAYVTASDTSVCGTPTLTLDRTIAGLNTTDSVIDLTQQPTARFIVRNNLAHECRCHGIITDSPYGWIDNNVYFDNSAGGIGLVGGSGFGPGGTNILMSNNYISDSGQSTQYSGTIAMFAPTATGEILDEPLFEKLRFSNNVFEQLPGPAIIATSTRYLSIEDSTIVNSNLAQADPTNYGTIPSLDSIIVYEAGDGTVCGTLRSGNTTGPIGIDPTAKTVTVHARCE
jgi:hypothetical protein